MSRQEPIKPIDRRPGNPPSITRTDHTVTYELGILVRPGRALVIACDRDGEITLRIRDASAHRGTP